MNMKAIHGGDSQRAVGLADGEAGLGSLGATLDAYENRE